MDISAVRAALADLVHDTLVLNDQKFITATWYTPDSVVEPHFFVAEYDIEYNKSMRGLTKVDFTCRLLFSRTDEQSSQREVDKLFSPSGAGSLKTIIEASRNHSSGALGGIVDDLQVVRMQGNRLYEHGTAKYVGGEIIVMVMGE